MATASKNREAQDSHPDKVDEKLFKISILTFGRITVALPLGALVFCFLTCIIFKFDQVNRTVCNIPNLIPSISAITGVTPQRYIWRVCIALHCTPRFAVGFLYYNWFMGKVDMIAHHHRGLFQKLVKINFWLYTLENSCLVGVTYIANVENYPVHEKIFIVFMVTSLCYELLMIILFRWTHPDPLSDDEVFSYKWKRVCFVTIICCTAGLLYFFLRHRLYCEPLAFSWFSIFEYAIAIINICFHYTATVDFKDRYWVCGMFSSSSAVNNHKKDD